MKISTQQYLNTLAEKLIHKSPKEHINLTRGWAKQFPKEAGVYVLFESGELVYAGETGSIRGRMTDYLDTRHHTVRRKIGALNFSKVKGFESANSKLKFPAHIEKLVINWLEKKVELCYLVVDLGRKELEEYIISEHSPKYNSKGQRGV